MCMWRAVEGAVSSICHIGKATHILCMLRVISSAMGVTVASREEKRGQYASDEHQYIPPFEWLLLDLVLAQLLTSMLLLVGQQRAELGVPLVVLHSAACGRKRDGMLAAAAAACSVVVRVRLRMSVAVRVLSVRLSDGWHDVHCDGEEERAA